MDGKKDFTVDGVAFYNLSGFVRELHSYGLKYVIMMVCTNTEWLPSFSFQSGKKLQNNTYDFIYLLASWHRK